MDWTGVRDVHERFKLFKQNWQQLFDSPLAGTEEDKTVRMLLLWVGDKDHGIYNAATWAVDVDNLRVNPVFAA